jgi:DNA-binding NtrC family response regulator
MVYSQPGSGTVFHVYLPVYTGKPIRAKNGSRSAPLMVGDGEHILVVDDETAVCDVVGTVLSRVGYQVTQHTNPGDALDAFRDDPDKYDLVLTDLTMPGMTGIDLAKRLFEIRPGLPVLLTTGFGGSWETKVVEELGIRKVIQKPADFNSLGLVVHEALYGDGK